MSVNGTAIENDKGESLTFDMLVTGAKALSSVMGATEKAASFFQDIYNAGTVYDMNKTGMSKVGAQV